MSRSCRWVYQFGGGAKLRLVISLGRKFHCLFMSRSCRWVYQFGGGEKLRLVISLELVLLTSGLQATLETSWETGNREAGLWKSKFSRFHHQSFGKWQSIWTVILAKGEEATCKSQSVLSLLEQITSCSRK